MRAIRRLLIPLAIIAAIASVPACKTASTPAPTSIVTIDTGEWKIPFKVELATTDAEQQKGLMFRAHMDPDAGMLFVFDRDSVHTFWMKNTLIPLDMLFISSDQTIVGIVENATPQTETPRAVGLPSRYVLEINGGLSSRYGFRAGQAVQLPMAAPAK
jgi:uncharacterized membrane protein (UPF0127 family)